ncbi:MAG: hypothetical protein K5790_03940 [Nitrosopumilus sp.]|uniref:hypothetical protein n=1 Tax=Nitrosopumilus sp. TaxID=2024843 RepID=UPI00247B8A0B|nr:hypothetical protein [Nitrosopumilus sp.]MCV0392432.1 hypothetical protein [Nitrosopumilus sp.]
MHQLLVLFFAILIAVSFISSNAEIQNVSTNKSQYYFGDSLVISGSVSYDSSIPSIILQIITPSGNGLAHIDSIIPKTSGSFSKSINVGGPTWSEDGQYTLKLSYGENFEKTIQYTNLKESESETKPSDNSPPNQSPTIPTNDSLIDDELETEIFYKINPKMKLLGFPSFDKSPQYYIDRYNSESDYKIWFDSQFPNFSIDDVVGYETTHIENFPSFDKSPQYYINRYNSESQYRSWFDSQFEGRTIYDVLGFHTYIPVWIKSYAQNWATGQISDDEFMIGLDFMLDNNIITIPGLDYGKTSVDEIPSWFRNTAHWWSKELISQQEFINSIKYLIQENIILVE